MSHDDEVPFGADLTTRRCTRCDFGVDIDRATERTSVSGKFLSKLPGERSKSGSKAGSRKLENPYSSRIFILGFPRLSRVGALPKLDVAGSTPVARSTNRR